jgi:hypothetical protein
MSRRLEADRQFLVRVLFQFQNLASAHRHQQLSRLDRATATQEYLAELHRAVAPVK